MLLKAGLPNGDSRTLHGVKQIAPESVTHARATIRDE
jgi:hypothetical protein